MVDAKIRRNEPKIERKHNGRFSVGAAVLVAGLALLPGCKHGAATGHTEMQKITPSKMSAPTQAACDVWERLSLPGESLPRLPFVSHRKGKCTVREGDVLFNIEKGRCIECEDGGLLPFSWENAPERVDRWSWHVSKIDEKGIEVTETIETFRSENTNSKSVQERVNLDYGGVILIEIFRAAIEFNRGGWQIIAREAVMVGVEKGTVPGTAVVEVRRNQGVCDLSCDE